MSDYKRAIEQEGVKYFGFKSAQFNVLVRETDTHDKGIDAEVEVCKSFTIDGKTPFVGIQVKSRTDAKTLADGNFTLSVTEQNLDYWSKYGRPVVLILYDKSSSELYWERVDKAKSTQIHINKNSIYNASSISSLVNFCREYAIKIIQETSFVEFEPILASLGNDYGSIAQPLIKRLKDFYSAYENELFDESCTLIKPLAEIFYDSKDIISNCALAHSQNNDKESLTYIRKLLQLDAIGFSEYALSATCFANFDDFEKSLPLFRKSLKLHDCIETKNNYALTLYRAGEYEESELIFSSLVKSSSIDAKAMFNYALLLTATNRFEESISAYESAILKDASLADAYNNMALLYQAMGMHDQAFKAYSRGIKNSSEGCYYLWVNYARLLKDYGEDQKSLEYYMKAIEYRGEGSIYRDVALLYCRLGNTNEAEDILSKQINSIFDPSMEIVSGTKTAILDTGFEVQYVLKIETVDDRIIIFEFHDCSEKSLFNGLREYANEHNIPFGILKNAFLEENSEKRLKEISAYHCSTHNKQNQADA
ncbi:DUF4365 domain-containing protein [Alteromonas sp. a30]|uniref:DUF4365 domain-containing protein n=1 Tax=Alteromonas sp. a30 TaxID=2730917 RepID=UPI0022832E01|nr:DUF4365 domain-containing protein [Alteromonas sp. a30]MCY7294874.1 DUF4365 domain-containing protein [Alteromonas sp. a30]